MGILCRRPTSSFLATDISAEALAARLGKDKKTIQQKIHFVLPTKIGEVIVRSDITLDQATRAIARALGDCQ